MKKIFKFGFSSSKSMSGLKTKNFLDFFYLLKVKFLKFPFVIKFVEFERVAVNVILFL